VTPRCAICQTELRTPDQGRRLKVGRRTVLFCNHHAEKIREGMQFLGTAFAVSAQRTFASKHPTVAKFLGDSVMVGKAVREFIQPPANDVDGPEDPTPIDVECKAT